MIIGRAEYYNNEKMNKYDLMEFKIIEDKIKEFIDKFNNLKFSKEISDSDREKLWIINDNITKYNNILELIDNIPDKGEFLEKYLVFIKDIYKIIKGEYWRSYIIEPPGNGKTFFILKLIDYIVNTNLLKCPIKYIYLDKEEKKWKLRYFTNDNIKDISPLIILDDFNYYIEIGRLLEYDNMYHFEKGNITIEQYQSFIDNGLTSFNAAKHLIEIYNEYETNNIFLISTDGLNSLASLITDIEVRKEFIKTFIWIATPNNDPARFNFEKETFIKSNTDKLISRKNIKFRGYDNIKKSTISSIEKYLKILFNIDKEVVLYYNSEFNKIIKNKCKVKYCNVDNYDIYSGNYIQLHYYTIFNAETGKDVMMKSYTMQEGNDCYFNPTYRNFRFLNIIYEQYQTINNKILNIELNRYKYNGVLKFFKELNIDKTILDLLYSPSVIKAIKDKFDILYSELLKNDAWYLLLNKFNEKEDNNINRDLSYHFLKYSLMLQE